MTSSLAIVVLGMHRSGTSCVAGMLASAGLASAGEALRNWDNARGHHEMLDVIRLDEAVLAHSGGHWLSPPAELRWTADHAAARDRLLRARIDGRPALLKDPRMLLALPFWRASSVPFHVIGIVRHPLAVARSLESWREIPLAEGVALWSAHNRALAEDRARHRYALVDFGAPAAAVVAAVAAGCAARSPLIDEAALAGAYEEQLVHHDHGDAPAAAVVAAVAAGCAATAPLIDDAALAAAYEEQLVHHDHGDAPAVAGLAEAEALYRQLTGAGSARARPAFPRAELAAFARLLREHAIAAALQPARAALAAVADPAAVLVPVVTALVRHRAHAEARALIAEHAARLDDGLADLLHAKVLLAIGDGARAVHHLEAACAVPRPFYQARHLLPQALRAAGRHAEARAALRDVASIALYPHGPLATLAEWSWLDGDHGTALEEMQRAIAAAPLHRRGRLRTRRAEWLLVQADPPAARAELLQAIDEDPGYGRSREVLASLA